MKYFLNEKDWSKMVEPWAQAYLGEYQNCMVLSWPDWDEHKLAIGESKQRRAEVIDDMIFWCQQSLPSEAFAVVGERRIVTCFFFKQRDYMMLFKLAHA